MYLYCISNPTHYLFFLN